MWELFFPKFPPFAPIFRRISFYPDIQLLPKVRIDTLLSCGLFKSFVQKFQGWFEMKIYHVTVWVIFPILPLYLPTLDHYFFTQQFNYSSITKEILLFRVIYFMHSCAYSFKNHFKLKITMKGESYEWVITGTLRILDLLLKPVGEMKRPSWFGTVGSLRILGRE